MNNTFQVVRHLRFPRSRHSENPTISITGSRRVLGAARTRVHASHGGAHGPENRREIVLSARGAREKGTVVQREERRGKRRQQQQQQQQHPTQTLGLSNTGRIFFCSWQPGNEESAPRGVSYPLSYVNAHSRYVRTYVRTYDSCTHVRASGRALTLSL